MLVPFRVTALPKARVWGGSRLGPPAPLPIGELWLAGPWIEVASGPWSGRTLEDAAIALGPDLVGTAAPASPGPRFPLLAKLLDPIDWLSVQVHPDDRLARQLEGPTAVGKTEAWYVVEAEPGAELLLGTRPGVTLAEVHAAIGRPAGERGSAVIDLMERVVVRTGDAVPVPAGTLHAVGPGLLVYELQQPSDITYRVDDWGRPATAGRALQTAQALASVRADGVPVIRQAAVDGTLLASPHFTLALATAATALDPAGRTLHVVTAVAGDAEIAGAGWSERLDRFETLVIPAAAHPYDLVPAPGAQVLIAALP